MFIQFLVLVGAVAYFGILVGTGVIGGSMEGSLLGAVGVTSAIAVGVTMGFLVHKAVLRGG